MAIKIYRGGYNNTVAPGATGIAAWLKAFSPGNRMRLKRVMITFNAYETLSNLRAVQYISRDNYINCWIDNSTLPHPFNNMNRNAAIGNPVFSPGHGFELPGVYEVDYQFEDQIWMNIFSYNFSAVQYHHLLEVIFTVEETPLN